MADTFVACNWTARDEYAPLAIVMVDYVGVTRGVQGLDEARFTARELEPRFQVVGLERLINLEYSEVLEYVDKIIRGNEALLRRDLTVIACINTTGKAIDFYLEGLEMLPEFMIVTDETGTSSYADNIYRVPRSELVASIASAYAKNLVRVAKKLKLAPVLANQLADLRIRSDTGSKVRALEESEVEDLARVLGMCLWLAQQEHTRDLTYLDRLESEFAEQDDGWDVFRYARSRKGSYG